MLNRTQLKNDAKALLGNGIFSSPWLNALLVTLVASLILGVSSFVAILVIGPISYGLAKIFLNVARGQGGYEINRLFDGFTEDFVGTFLLGLMQSLLIFLWSLLFVIPGIIKSYAYSFAFYVRVDHPDYDWKRCLDESDRITQGHKGELFLLDLSFLGWMIVGSLACGVGTLWVSPWMSQTRAQAYLFLTAQQEPVYAEPAPEM